MKRSEEIRNELEALKAEREAKIKAMVWENPERTNENHDALWDIFWKTYGWGSHRKEEALDFELHKALNQEIEVGDGVTMKLYSDAPAYTVIAKTAKTITIQRDTATLDPNFKPEWIAGGFAGHCTNQDEQTYTYERNPEGEKVRCYWSERLGCYTTGGDQSIRIRRGRHEFYDYNF